MENFMQMDADEGGGRLAVRELLPLAAQDSTPGDLSLATEQLALNPVMTLEMTPVQGDALLFRPGAVGAKGRICLSSGRRRRRTPRSLRASWRRFIQASTWLRRKELTEEGADGAVKTIKTSEVIAEVRLDELDRIRLFFNQKGFFCWSPAELPATYNLVYDCGGSDSRHIGAAQ